MTSTEDGARTPVNPIAAISWGPTGVRADGKDLMGACCDRAKAIAVALQHSEITFAHLLMAMTLEPSARDRLATRTPVDIARLRSACFSAFPDIIDATLPHPPYDRELAEIVRRAESRAGARSIEHDFQTPYSVQDVLNIVEELAEDTPARRLLAGVAQTPAAGRIDEAAADIEAQVAALRQVADLLRSVDIGRRGFEDELRPRIDDLAQLLAEQAARFNSLAGDHSVTRGIVTELQNRIDEIPTSTLEQKTSEIKPDPPPRLKIVAGIVLVLATAIGAFVYFSGGDLPAVARQIIRAVV